MFSRTATWDGRAQRVLLRYRYDPPMNDALKRLGGRFDPGPKVWYISGVPDLQLLQNLEGLGFEIDAALQRTLSGETAAPPAQAFAPPAVARIAGTQTLPLPTHAGDVTVGELVRSATRAVERAFPDALWVVGRVSGVERSLRKASGWLSFQLADEDQHGRAGATISVFLASDAWSRIRNRLEEVGLSLADGMMLRLRGVLSLYDRAGSLNLRGIDCDPRFSQGELALRRERVLAQIAAEGLTTRNQALPVPSLPLRIVVLTSHGSDAWHDLTGRLAESGWPFRVTTLDVRVQGDGLVPSVIRALAWVRRNVDDFDVCVITRGGGARADLAGWDDVRVAREVATLPCKVLVAIGHDQDRCALDELAWSARTPTDAANQLVDGVAAVDAALRVAATRLADLGHDAIARGEARLQRSASRLPLFVQRLVSQQEKLLGQAGLRVRGAARMHLQSREQAVQLVAPGVARGARRRLALATTALDTASSRLSPSAVHQRLDTHGERLHGAGAQLHRAALRHLDQLQTALDSRARVVRAMDPQRLVERGFVVLRDTNGRVISSVASLSPGHIVLASLADGGASLTVDAVTRAPRSGPDDRVAAEPPPPNFVAPRRTKSRPSPE